MKNVLLCALLTLCVTSSCVAPEQQRVVNIPVGVPSQVHLPNPFPMPETVPSPSPLPIQTKTPSHIGFNCIDCTKEQQVKLKAAEQKANEIVQGQCFYDFMKDRHLIWTQKKTNQQVIEDLRSANLTVPIHYYWGTTLFGKCNGTVGYRQPPRPDIYFNQCYHQYYDVCDTASNGTHEWSHNLNYDHSFYPTSNRGLTVPYSINNAFDRCCTTGHGYRGNVREATSK